jgi:Putative auto-transporter adhesin, head GIN domain
MKNTGKYCLLLFLLICVLQVNAQLKGEGKIITREFDFKDFDELIIEDFDGIVEIEIGKAFAIKVEIDENLEPRLRVNKNGSNQLKLYLDGNTNGKLYLEDVNIKIKISMPSASFIRHRGNTNVSINGVKGHHFKLEQSGNGDVEIEGEVNELDIDKKGNGDVNARKLITKTAKIKTHGNGDITVFAQISLTAIGQGNGDVYQAGPGEIENISGISGNGSVKKI